MKNKIKILLAAICLCILQITISAQQKPIDDEITSLEKRLVELKEQKLQIEQKEREKKEYQEKLKNINTELDSLRGTTTDNSSSTTTANSVITPPTTAVAQTNTLTQRTSTTTNATQNQALAGTCRSLKNKQLAGTAITESEVIDFKICAIAEIAIGFNAGQIREDSSLSELAYIVSTELVKTTEQRTLLAESEKKRTDKQVGSTSSSSGTTSLVVKGGTSAILGWAFENGSTTSAVDGNTVTLRVNPYNLGKALFDGQSLFDIRSYDSLVSQNNTPFDLRKLSFGFSFDTTRGTDTPTFIVSKQQLASWSVRYEFINRRNPLSPYNKAKRDQYLQSQKPYQDAVMNAVLSMRSNPEFRKHFDAWLKGIDTDLGNIPTGLNCKSNPTRAGDAVAFALLTPAQLVFETCQEKAFAIIKAHLPSFLVAEVSKNTDVIQTFNTFTTAVETFRKNRKDFIDEVNKGTIVTLEYTNIREVNAPDLSNFRFIWEKGLYKRVDFTLNAEMTMFNKKPAMMDIKRIRDFNLAFQFDVPLNDVLSFGNSIFSFATRYTRQQSDVVLPNGVVADGTKGDIFFGQGKLTIPIGDTGIKLPLSFTFGNRSEFLKESFTRGNFGITFDLDQIFRPLSIFQ